MINPAHFFKWCLSFLALVFVAALAGCGGGGSSSSAITIRGTAAAGSPVIGYVSVRDSSSNPQPVKTNIPIEANGNYSVDVSGLTPPYAFLADGTVGGKRVTLYSAATSDDQGKTINITPFTDLMIRNIANSAIDTYITNGGLSGLTTAELNAQRDALTTALTPALTAMGVSSSIDLLRATFNADSTGLDRFMDVVKVDASNPSAVTISNILDAANQLVVDTTAGGTVSGTLPTTGMDPTATPLDGMLASAQAFSAKFATSLPSASDPVLAGLFADTFSDGGDSKAVFLTQITSDPTIVGLHFSNFVVDSIDQTGTIAQIHFVPLDGSGTCLSHDNVGCSIGWQMKLNSTTQVWQFDGDQHIARVRVRTIAERSLCYGASSTCNGAQNYYGTGLNLEVDDRAMVGIGSALVTGPGLPVGGVTLTAQQNQTWLNITTANPNNPCNGCSGSRWYMVDNDIASVADNSVYTIQLYDNSQSPVLLATYTDTVPVKPVLNTALTGLSYPSITSGMVNLAGTGAVNAHLSWTIPSGLYGDYMNLYVYQNNTNESQNAEATNMASTGTQTLSVIAPSSGTWTGGSYHISAWDQYSGSVDTNYQ